VHTLTSAAGLPARIRSSFSALVGRLHRLASSHRQGARVVAVAGVLALLTGVAGTAYAQVHKNISLDIDGTVTTVSTYAGSVDGVLKAKDVALSPRDTVAPATGTALQDGSEIVVRHAHQIQVETDGVTSTVWTTALSANDALAVFESRGGDVRLVASRSSSGRPELALRLTVNGPVKVQVDGTLLQAQDGSRSVAALLDQLGVTLGELDKVSVVHGADGVVTVVVNRVLVQDVPTVVASPFATTSQPDPTRFKGIQTVLTAGVAGSHTVVNRITTVDGVETARELLSDTVTAAPVDQVVAVGTKARAAAPASAAGPIAAGGSADSLNWAALAACESGGNPTIVSSNGLYYGLYQFSVGTWAAVGGSGTPTQASGAEQTSRAKMLYNRSGAGQWPVCGAKLFS
jgi:uncharacterized protein YabE (DUF348 family)